METKYLIVGNSVAGINCIEGIRKIDKNGKILVISKENEYNYSKPLISYYFGGKISEEQMIFKDRMFYKENSIGLLPGATALYIDVEKKNLVTDRGQIHFEKLLIATGGSPLIPEIQGYSRDIKGIWTFASFSDAKGLKKYIKETGIDTAVILGGGLIGLKCAEGLF
ncbi:MAG: FAD-dependent oxidoreductase, partial [Candidatus Omnitrophica bacterium]|nr:FAD-dependent oxidoreductase [Candidatus Omnitrophota bacterium]